MNEVDIQKIVNKTTRLITQIATFNYRSVVSKSNDLLKKLPWINEERKNELEQLPLLEKINALNQEQEVHFHALKIRWKQQNPSSILGGYDLPIKPVDTCTYEKQPCLIRKNDNTYAFWGYKDRKWQLTQLGKDFILPLEWTGLDKVFVSPQTTLFNIFKEAHTLDEGIFTELLSEEEKTIIRNEFTKADNEIAEELKKYPNITNEQRDQVYNGLLKDKVNRCVRIITHISEGYSKFSMDLCESITKTSDRMLAIQKIADVPWLNNILIHLLHLLAVSWQNKWRIIFILSVVAACLCLMLSVPIPHVESFTLAISSICE